MKNLFELIMTTATKSDELKQFSRLQVRILVLLFYAGFDTLHPDISVKILHTRSLHSYHETYKEYFI